MKQFIFLLTAIILAYSSAFCSPPAKNIDSSLSQTMHWALKKYHLAGMSVSYTLSDPADTKTLSVGYANVSHKKPISVESYFEVGSVSKAFISSIIMNLVAKGRISLDETLSVVAKKYPGRGLSLKKLVAKYPHLGIITLRQFLTHTSGIPQAINNKVFIKEFNQNPMGYWSPEKLLSIAMRDKPYFSPGEKGYYGYTNTDYIIMGLVIEAITGKSLLKNIHSLFAKIGLENIHFAGSPHASNIPLKVRNKLAQAYVTKLNNTYDLSAFSHSAKVIMASGVAAKNITAVALNFAAVAPASGGIIVQTPTLVKWYWLLFHGRVVPSGLFPEMLKGVETADPNKKYGLAVVVQATKHYGTIYSHEGDVFGYGANVLYVPKLHLVIAIAVNTSTGILSSITHAVIGRMLHTFVGD